MIKEFAINRLLFNNLHVNKYNSIFFQESIRTTSIKDSFKSSIFFNFINQSRSRFQALSHFIKHTCSCLCLLFCYRLTKFNCLTTILLLLLYIDNFRRFLLYLLNLLLLTYSFSRWKVLIIMFLRIIKCSHLLLICFWVFIVLVLCWYMSWIIIIR